MKICHLTSVHPAFDTRIFHKECKTLAQAGYETVLVVPHDRDEVRDGVQIRAVPLPRNRRERMRSTIRRIYTIALRERADLYLFHDPELIPVALLLRCRGRHVLYDVHEDYGASLSVSANRDWIPVWARGWIGLATSLAESVAAHWLDGIVAATPSIARRFPGPRTALVQNFPVSEELVSGSAIPYRERPFVLSYVGLITPLRGAKEMVQAAGMLALSLPVKLHIAGTFSPASLEKDLSSVKGWDRVVRLGQQSREGVADLLSRTRVGLVLFHPVPNHLDAQPNKMFEYMSAGIPVVASNFSLWREIVEGASCGLLVDPLDPAAIAEAVKWLLEHPVEAEAMGRRGQQAVRERYNWAREASKLLSVCQKFQRVSDGGRRPKETCRSGQ